MISYPKKLFYLFKPIIPRRLQLLLRRRLVAIQRWRSRNRWPIDPRAGAKPEGWSGWPDQKEFALVLMHDVETGLGQDKCRHLMQIEETMGFRSIFSFVPERYAVSSELRRELVKRGFEVGVHGLKHDGKLFRSKENFLQNANRINHYLREWRSVGFVSPSMHRNLDWMHALEIEFDASTFDTDPFEPQPEGVATIFPFMVHGGRDQRGYIELPYTLPQDFTLFVLMRETTIDIWKRKLDWIVKHGGMALVITHPDYMQCGHDGCTAQEYPIERYKELLGHVKQNYEGRYWNPLPKEIARFWKGRVNQSNADTPLSAPRTDPQAVFGNSK